MTHSPDFTSIRQSLLEKIASGRLPSIVIAVTHHGETLWHEALGWADRQRQIPASTATIYPIASVSKSITATGLMVLAESGRLDLDDPLTRYLPPSALARSPYSPEKVTVRQVVNMAAGIPHLWKYDYADQPETALSTAALVRKHGFLAAPPGKFHQYSNLAYGVIELIIAQAAGWPFAGFMQDELFDPLGMQDTSLKTGLPAGAAHSDAPHSYAPHIDGPHIDAPLSTAYDAENRPVAWDFHLRPDGAAGFYSSSRDLLRYTQFHLGRPVEGAPLSPAALQALHQIPDSQTINSQINPIAHYAMGWGIVEDGRYTSLWSNGAMLGCSAMILLVPSEELGVVCLSNYTSPDSISDQTAIQIAGALLPGFAENLQTRISEVEEAERQAAADPGFAGAWQGSVTLAGGSIPLALEISPQNEVRLRLGEQDAATADLILEDARLAKDFLEARAACSLPLDQTFDEPHMLVFELRLARHPVDGSDRLEGVARAESTLGRPYFGLPFYTSLERRRH